MKKQVITGLFLLTGLFAATVTQAVEIKREKWLLNADYWNGRVDVLLRASLAVQALNEDISSISGVITAPPNSIYPLKECTKEQLSDAKRLIAERVPCSYVLHTEDSDVYHLVQTVEEVDLDWFFTLSPLSSESFINGKLQNLQSGENLTVFRGSRGPVQVSESGSEESFKQELEELSNQQQYEALISRATELIRKFPNSATFWSYRGWAYMMTQNYPGCIYDASQSINRTPSDSFSWRVRSICFRGNGQYSKALYDANKAIASSPKNVLGYWVRADAYKSLKNCPKANADYLTVCSAQTGHEKACVQYWCGESEENVEASLLAGAGAVIRSRDYLASLRKNNASAADDYMRSKHFGYINHFTGLKILYERKYGAQSLINFLHENGIYKFPFY